jgi:hypothetical protein
MFNFKVIIIYMFRELDGIIKLLDFSNFNHVECYEVNPNNKQSC